MERDLAKMEGKRYDRPPAKGRDPEDEWMDGLVKMAPGP